MSKLIKGIHHVALKVAPQQFDKVVSFYTELLGLSPVRGWGEGDERALMISTGDNSVLEVLSTVEECEVGTGGFAHLAFMTDEVDQLIKTVRSAGYTITIEPKDVDLPTEPKAYPVRIAFCKGPVGEIIEFFHER